MKKILKAAAISTLLIAPQGSGSGANLYSPEEMCHEQISDMQKSVSNNIENLKENNKSLSVKALGKTLENIEDQGARLERILNCIKSL